MKSVEVSENGFFHIKNAQSENDREVTLSEIADSFSTIANIIQAGRDNPDISFYTDDLLRVMDTLSSYNSLYNAISETTDNKYNGCFIFHDKEDGNFSVRYENKAEEKEGKN